MTDDPNPKRRSALRHALGGLALVVLIAVSAVLLEGIGVTNWGSWTRQVRAQLGGGRAGMRQQVSVGMTRREVEARIGGSGEVYVAVSFGVAPGGRGPVRESAYPWPFARATYPEYGFTVVYHCPDAEDTGGWTVCAVEDSD